MTTSPERSIARRDFQPDQRYSTTDSEAFLTGVTGYLYGKAPGVDQALDAELTR